MKYLLISGLAAMVAAAFSGCTTATKHSDSDWRATQHHQQHRKDTEQTIKGIESRVSQQPDPR